MPGSQVEVNDIKNSFERGESKTYGIIFPVFMSQILQQFDTFFNSSLIR